MRGLFTKPWESLSGDDVREVIGWPESLTVEFKEDLSVEKSKGDPDLSRRKDPWWEGGRVGGFAKRKLFKEIVAFANTAGGHLVLGISETKEKEQPHSAENVTPLPRCVDLAERLEQAAQSIDPPIPLLLVTGIPTSDDGSGVVLFRVPLSRSGPHRSIDNECYIRRGANSDPIKMREIRDLTLLSENRASKIDAIFVRCATEFNAWMTAPSESQRAGFRLTAVPVGASLDLGRPFGSSSPLIRPFNSAIEVNGANLQLTAPQMPDRETPILRGTRFSRMERDCRNFIDIHADGVVNIGFEKEWTDGLVKLPLQWIVGYLIVLAKTTETVRVKAGVPDCEYAIEGQILAHRDISFIPNGGYKPLAVLDFSRGGEMPPSLGSIPGSLTLPRLSFGPMSELDGVMSAFCTDLCDALGVRRLEPMRLRMPNH